MIPFLFWLVINVLVGYAIGKRKDSVGGSIILSILLGPIGWLIAALWPGDVRRCPFCAENVKREAKVCVHCGRDITPLSNTPIIAGRLAIFFTLLIGLLWAVISLSLTLTRPERARREAAAVNSRPAITTSFPTIATPESAIHYAVATATPSPTEELSAPTPWPTRAPDPSVVTLTKPLAIPIPEGSYLVPRGTQLPLISRVGGDRARVSCNGVPYDIPISATDLK